MSRRKFLLLDFACALGGAALYLAAFDFFIGTLGVPRWLVRMNFAYAGLCVFASFYLLSLCSYPGAVLLLGEALLIGLLARTEGRY